MIDIQLALLDYFGNGKPVRNAIHWKGLEHCTRQEIIRKRNAMLELGLLKSYGPATGGKLYRVTVLGRQYIEKFLKEMK